MNILLAVSGGIAAYKACELVSLARRSGHGVRVAMTANATRLVGPATFQALCGHPVLVDTFQGWDPSSIDHIAWAKWAQVAVVAPATANLIGKLACGIADDAVTTVFMALPPQVPRLLAPAMNTAMWLNPVVQRNMGWLRDLGSFHFVDPVEKRLACGDVGVGAMADASTILNHLETMEFPAHP